MKDNIRKMVSYYRPYKKVFFLDMFFAFLLSVISLVIPLAVRYITGSIGNLDKDAAFHRVIWIGCGLIVLVILQFGSNYYVGTVGHIMGAKIEYDMRKSDS